MLIAFEGQVDTADVVHGTSFSGYWKMGISRLDLRTHTDTPTMDPLNKNKDNVYQE